MDTGALVEEENAELVLGSLVADVPEEEEGSWEVEGVLEGLSEEVCGVEVVGGTGVELVVGGTGVLEEVGGVDTLLGVDSPAMC